MIIFLNDSIIKFINILIDLVHENIMDNIENSQPNSYLGELSVLDILPCKVHRPYKGTQQSSHG